MINLNKLKYHTEYYKNPIIGIINDRDPYMYSKFKPSVLEVRRYDLDLGVPFIKDYETIDDEQGLNLVEELYFKQRDLEMKLAISEFIKKNWCESFEESYNLKHLSKPSAFCILDDGEQITKEEAEKILVGELDERN